MFGLRCAEGVKAVPEFSLISDIWIRIRDHHHLRSFLSGEAVLICGGGSRPGPFHNLVWLLIL